MMRILWLLLIIAILMSTDALAQDNCRYFKDGKCYWGRYFYDEKPKEVAQESEQKPSQSVEEEVERLQKEWKEAMSRAYLNPTEENLHAFYKSHVQTLQRAEDFGNAIEKFVWLNPEYDYRLKAPTNSAAAGMQRMIELTDREKKLKGIAKEKGLIYVFRSDCPYCQKFSPIVKRLASTFGFTVIPVSLDNKGLPSYPNPKPDVYISKWLKVSVVPAMYMVDPDDNEVISVGFGYADYNKLADKIVSSFERAQKIIQEDLEIAEAD